MTNPSGLRKRLINKNKVLSVVDAQDFIIYIVKPDRVSCCEDYNTAKEKPANQLRAFPKVNEHDLVLAKKLSEHLYYTSLSIQRHYKAFFQKEN